MGRTTIPSKATEYSTKYPSRTDQVIPASAGIIPALNQAKGTKTNDDFM
jgi:hypothetical protein